MWDVLKLIFTFYPQKKAFYLFVFDLLKKITFVIILVLNVYILVNIINTIWRNIKDIHVYKYLLELAC